MVGEVVWVFWLCCGLLCLWFWVWVLLCMFCVVGVVLLVGELGDFGVDVFDCFGNGFVYIFLYLYYSYFGLEVYVDGVYFGYGFYGLIGIGFGFVDGVVVVLLVDG